MKITQVAELVNGATEQATGQSNVLNEDLSNTVDLSHQHRYLFRWKMLFRFAWFYPQEHHQQKQY